MNKKERERCTQKVTAVCTATRRGDADFKHSHYPVYEFDYEGKHYTVSKDQNKINAEIGSVHEFYINPDNPEEYYYPEAEKGQNAFAMIFIVAFGLAFLIQLVLVISSMLS